jgi:hypothetical protein
MGTIHEVKNTGEILLKLFPSNPVSPVEGMIIYNSTDKKLKFYDGTQWVG